MKHRLRYAEVYITNVCNYSCTHCQSLNNFAFKGHQRWEDYQHEYKNLSERIDFGNLQILGGEPTLNPDFGKWVRGISDLWPCTNLQIVTNGSRFDKIDRDIYQILASHKGDLYITCHDIALYEEMLEFSKSFLDEIIDDYHEIDDKTKRLWKNSYQVIKDDSWPDCDHMDDFVNLSDEIKLECQNLHQFTPDLFLRTVPRVLTDKNHVSVKLSLVQTFVSSAVAIMQGNQTRMKYNNDPVEAHKNCVFSGCHQINKGQLYKCPLVSVLPDFLSQFDVGISVTDKQLAKSYIPMTARDNDNDIAKFIQEITEPIPQCKFCPVDDKQYTFVGTDKKLKIKIHPIRQGG